MISSIFFNRLTRHRWLQRYDPTSLQKLLFCYFSLFFRAYVVALYFPARECLLVFTSMPAIQYEPERGAAMLDLGDA